MAGHAQLKFVMTECSKTQIRLTGQVIARRITDLMLPLSPNLFYLEDEFENTQLCQKSQLGQQSRRKDTDQEPIQSNSISCPRYQQEMFWFDFCFTGLQHILGHFERGQLP